MRNLFFILALLLAAPAARAQDNYSANYKRDARIKTLLSTVRRECGSDEKQRLVNAQNKWEAHMEAELVAYAGLYKQKGAECSQYINSLRLKMKDERIIALENFIAVAAAQRERLSGIQEAYDAPQPQLLKDKK